MALPLLLALLTACGDPKPVTDALHRAETLMNEYPDSALAVLNTLSPDAMGKESTRALYALLYTQAQDKNYIDVTNDSLITLATDYYRQTDDVRRKFLSFYYRGRVLVNAGESIKAMVLFLEAEKLSEVMDDDYLRGLLYTQMGDIYRFCYDYSKSLEMFQKAEIFYDRGGKNQHRLYALMDQASVCRNMGENEDSYQLLQTVLMEAKQKGYSRLVELCLGDGMMLCVSMQNYKKAELLFLELQQKFDLSSMSSSFMANVAEIHAKKNEWDFSKEVLLQAWQRAKTEKDSILLYFAEARIHEMQHPQTDAYYSMLKGINRQNLLIRRNMEQPILSLQNNVLATELKYQQYKQRIEQIQQWLIFLLVIMVLVGVVYKGQKWLRKLYRKQMRERFRRKESDYQLELQNLQKKVARKDENIRALIEEFNKKTDIKDMNFRRTLTELENELASKDKLYREYVQLVDTMRNDKEHCMAKLNQIFKERIELTDEILRVQITDFAANKFKDNALIGIVDNFMNKVAISKKTYVALEEWVNMSNQNVMIRLRSEVKLPDEDSYRQFCYHAAGYSVYGIAALMGETKNKIYKRRDRIRKKIEELSPESMDLFMRYLSK